MNKKSKALGKNQKSYNLNLIVRTGFSFSIKNKRAFQLHRVFCSVKCQGPTPIVKRDIVEQYRQLTYTFK